MTEQYPDPPNYQLITTGMETAEARRQPIDDRTAREIASIVPMAEDSATRQLAATGEIDMDRVTGELYEAATARGLTDFEMSMYNHLGTYAVVAGSRGPVDGWNDEPPTEPIPHIDM